MHFHVIVEVHWQQRVENLGLQTIKENPIQETHRLSEKRDTQNVRDSGVTMRVHQGPAYHALCLKKEWQQTLSRGGYEQSLLVLNLSPAMLMRPPQHKLLQQSPQPKKHRRLFPPANPMTLFD